MDPTADDEEARGHIDELGETGAKILKWGEGLALLAGAATVFELVRDFLSEHLQEMWKTDSLIWKLAIVIYFTSWLFGAEFDKRRQMRVYRYAPKQVKANILLIIVAYALVLLFVLMVMGEELTMLGQASDGTKPGFLAQIIHFWIVESDKIFRFGFVTFLTAINALWAINILGWIGYLHYVINPTSAYCKTIYAKQRDPYPALEKVRIEDEYIKGRWQIARFLLGTLLLAAIDGVLYGSRLTDSFETKLAFSLAILAYIIIVEGWIWRRRLRAGADERYIDSLARRYSFLNHSNE